MHCRLLGTHDCTVSYDWAGILANLLLIVHAVSEKMKQQQRQLRKLAEKLLKILMFLAAVLQSCYTVSWSERKQMIEPLRKTEK